MVGLKELTGDKAVRFPARNAVALQGSDTRVLRPNPEQFMVWSGRLPLTDCPVLLMTGTRRTHIRMHMPMHTHTAAHSRTHTHIPPCTHTHTLTLSLLRSPPPAHLSLGTIWLGGRPTPFSGKHQEGDSNAKWVKAPAQQGCRPVQQGQAQQ